MLKATMMQVKKVRPATLSASGEFFFDRVVLNTPNSRDISKLPREGHCRSKEFYLDQNHLLRQAQHKLVIPIRRALEKFAEKNTHLLRKPAGISINK